MKVYHPSTSPNVRFTSPDTPAERPSTAVFRVLPTPHLPIDSLLQYDGVVMWKTSLQSHYRSRRQGPADTFRLITHSDGGLGGLAGPWSNSGAAATDIARLGAEFPEILKIPLTYTSTSRIEVYGISRDCEWR